MCSSAQFWISMTKTGNLAFLSAEGSCPASRATLIWLTREPLGRR